MSKHLQNTVSFFVLAICASSAGVLAQTSTQGGTAAQIELIEQSLQTSAEKQAAISSEIEKAVKAQSEISDKLVALGKSLEVQQVNIKSADLKIKSLSAEAIVIRSDLGAKQEQLSELLAGLQRLEQNPPPALVVDPQDVLQALRGAMMFGAVVPGMRDQALALQAQLARLEAIQTESVALKAKLLEANLGAVASINDLKILQQQKKDFAVTAAEDLNSEKLRAATLAEQAKSLKQLLASLEAEKLAADAKKSAEAKAREEAEKQKLAALSKPNMVMSAQRGKLNAPLLGTVLKQFGEDNGLGSKVEGVAIAASGGQTVLSPVDGRVEFAGPFRSYGELLILNAGEGYLVLLAGMTQISAEIGQSIKAGEPVGTMGDGPSSVALIGDIELTRPVLYIEFRLNNEPVDPSPWWVGGRKEALK
jgi:murein hydrolase activator